MYTTSGARGAQHQWVPTITNVGVPSYVNVQIYRPFAGNTHTSISCPSLGCTGFLRIPRANIIFSIASSSKLPQMDNITPEGQPYVYVTLPPFEAAMLELLKNRIADIVASVKELKRLIAARPSADENQSSDSGGDVADGE